MGLSQQVQKRSGTVADEGGFAKKQQNMLDRLDPSNTADPGIPRYGSGARSLIRIAGKPIGLCQSFTWTISYLATPIHTIDSLFAWDVDIGQASIRGRLEQIIDPVSSAEADFLFHTMQSAVHQPMVEMQILDLVGTSLFFCRGMFTELQTSVNRGQISVQSAGFIGVAY